MSMVRRIRRQVQRNADRGLLRRAGLHGLRRKNAQRALIEKRKHQKQDSRETTSTSA